MLVEWNNVTINLKFVKYIFRNLDTLRLEVYFMGEKDGAIGHNCDTKKQMDKDYEELMMLIKLSSNFKTDDEGHFMCSHCGAPN